MRRIYGTLRVLCGPDGKGAGADRSCFVVKSLELVLPQLGGPVPASDAYVVLPEPLEALPVGHDWFINQSATSRLSVSFEEVIAF